MSRCVRLKDRTHRGLTSVCLGPSPLCYVAHGGLFMSLRLILARKRKGSRRRLESIVRPSLSLELQGAHVVIRPNLLLLTENLQRNIFPLTHSVFKLSRYSMSSPYMLRLSLAFASKIQRLNSRLLMGAYGLMLWKVKHRMV